MKLFKHLKACVGRCEESAFANVGTADTTENIREKVSNAPPLGISTGMGYRGFAYATAAIRLSKTAKPQSCCFDTGCSATLIDQEFLKRQDLSVQVRTMASLLKIDGIAGNQHVTLEYVIATLGLPARTRTGLLRESSIASFTSLTSCKQYTTRH